MDKCLQNAMFSVEYNRKTNRLLSLYIYMYIFNGYVKLMFLFIRMKHGDIIISNSFNDDKAWFLQNWHTKPEVSDQREPPYRFSLEATLNT